MESINVGEHDDVKKIRMSEWKAMIEQEIQDRLVVASELRKIISEAKTETKRVYYTKKFKKVNGEVYRLVSTLQNLLASEAAATPDPTTTLDLTPTDENVQLNTAT